MMRPAKFYALLLSVVWMVAWPTGAPSASGSGLYEAIVPLPANSEQGRAEAFAEAMRRVLVQVTGREGAPEEPALAPLVREAGRYVQRYRLDPDNQLFVGFDAQRIERLIVAADPSQVREITVMVEGVGSVQSYAEVTGFLESLALMRRLDVTELRGETVRYRAQVRGDAGTLAEAIAGNGRLLPQSGAGAVDAAVGVDALRYRFSP